MSHRALRSSLEVCEVDLNLPTPHHLSPRHATPPAPPSPRSVLAMVGLIVLRAIRRDLGRYSAIDLDDELGSVQEDFGWKLVANEVFRACRKRTQLALAVGCGAHLAAVSAVTLLFALFAIIGPANRGSLTTVMLVLYNVFGAVAGYVSSRVYATLQGEAPRKNMAVTAGVPGVVLFGVLFLVNLFLIGTGSSGAVPFGTFVALGLLWVLVDVPLSIVGGWIGIRHGVSTSFSQLVSINVLKMF